MASFVNGSQYTKKDKSNCILKSEVHFLCDTRIHWTTTCTSGGQMAVLPIDALLNTSFNEETCKVSKLH